MVLNNIHNGELLEGNVRIPSGCAISGIFSKSGSPFNGEDIIKSISVMHERSNGLGGGFAAYGIYPGYKEFYAFHVFFLKPHIRKDFEDYLERHFEVVNQSEIPTKKVAAITDEPLIWRYFVNPLGSKLKASQLDEREYVARCVFRVNTSIDDVFIFSSGKNMGVFKAIGYPEDVGRFYRLEDYEGYSFTAHGRYPTNTPGWWGGAHPFALLDYTVVHNGEISSYDANRRYVEMFGYKCSLQTDTEVIAYMIDLMNRKKGLTMEEICHVLAAPFWTTIERKDDSERKRLEYLRNAFASMLINGPFSILVGFTGGMMALNDRLKLRSMVAATKGDMVYFSSEEAAIRVIAPDLDRVWSPAGGEGIIVRLEDESKL